MDREEQVGAGFVRDVAAFVQRGKDVGFTRVDHLYVGKIIFD